MYNSLVSVKFKCSDKTTPQREKEVGKKLPLSKVFSPEDISPVHQKEHLGSLGFLSTGQGVKRAGPGSSNKKAPGSHEPHYLHLSSQFPCLSDAPQPWFPSCFPFPHDLLMNDS